MAPADKGMSALLDLADAEFGGRSFNGAPLMQTLEGLSLEQAIATGTWEGYSVWQVAHHVTYFKYFVARSLGVAGPLEPYPYEQADFAPAPPAASEAGWKEALAYLRRVHEVCMTALRRLEPERLEARMPEWRVTYRAAIAWLCTHDTYHTAQIRSMGVPGLKEARHK